ncbi:MAG TPA: addiction module protein [Longimicrobium sp.]|nr:addiction module protein [Longimicrobium sp.]
MTDTDAITEAALKLSPEARGKLAERLLASLPAPGSTTDWHAEINRRLDRLESGEAVLIDADEVLAKLKARRRR